jgi:hypothetical protein
MGGYYLATAALNFSIASDVVQTSLAMNRKLTKAAFVSVEFRLVR